MTTAKAKTFNQTLEREIALLGLEEAPEPGTLSRGQIIHSGSGELPVAMVTTAMESARYFYMWDTNTHERSISNMNMVRVNLRKRRKDGSIVFTSVDPKIEPYRGTLKCRLHVEHPDRVRFESMGFSTCPKANLRSQFDVMRHMQHRHKTEWASMEQDKTDVERKEDREVQHNILKALGGQLDLSTAGTGPSTPTEIAPDIDPSSPSIPTEPMPTVEIFQRAHIATEQESPGVAKVEEIKLLDDSTLFCACGKGFGNTKGRNNAKTRLRLHQRGAKHEQ